MHRRVLRNDAIRMYQSGGTVADVARRLGVPYRTVWTWCHRPPSGRNTSADRCFRCRPGDRSPDDPAAYCYLLGLYLGDGHLVTTARVPVLAIACTAVVAQHIPDRCLKT